MDIHSLIHGHCTYCVQPVQEVVRARELSYLPGIICSETFIRSSSPTDYTYPTTYVLTMPTTYYQQLLHESVII